MQIGNLCFPDRACFLAPLAGVGDRAMRELCLDYGAAGVTTEMVSAKGYVMGDRKSEELLFLSPKEHPGAIQLFGYDPATLGLAAEKAMAFGPDMIDINMGCPAPKIVGNGSGSTLLKNLPLAQEIAETVVKSVPVPVTCKIRTGWDSDHLVCVELAKRLEDAGVAAITVHGRTREQMYAPPVDYESIRQVKAAVSIPVIGNGDVTDGPSAAKMLELTGVDAIAVGRGAQGRPWVFQQVNAFLTQERILPEPPASERMRVLLKHVALLVEYKGEKVGMREARKHAAWYIRGVRGAAQYRNAIGKLSTYDELAELAYRVTQAENTL